LSGNVSRDEREQHVSFGEDELCAVKCNQETNSSGCPWRNGVDDSTSSNRWSIIEISFIAVDYGGNVHQDIKYRIAKKSLVLTESMHA